MKALFSGIALMIAMSSIAQTYVTQFRELNEEKWGCISVDGTVTVPGTYHGVFKFGEKSGYAAAFDNVTGKWYFIDSNGGKLKCGVSNWEPKNVMGFGRTGFENGLAIVVIDKKHGVINSSGEMVHSANYKKITKFTEDGYATAIGMDKTVYILKDDGSKVKLPSDIISANKFKNGMAPVRAKNKKFGFVNTKGEIIIDTKFHAVGYFADGLAWVHESKDMGRGYIDATGAYVLEPKYQNAKEFDPASGMALVKIVDDWFYVDKTGKELHVDGDRFVSFLDGLAEVRRGDFSGLMNNKGEFVTPFKYAKIKKPTDGIFQVQTPDGKWGFVNNKGEEIVAPKYIKTRGFNNGFAAVSEEKGVWGMIDLDGSWVLEPKYRNLKDVQKID